VANFYKNLGEKMVAKNWRLTALVELNRKREFVSTNGLAGSGTRRSIHLRARWLDSRLRGNDGMLRSALRATRLNCASAKKKGRRGAGVLVGPQAGRCPGDLRATQKIVKSGTHLLDAGRGNLGLVTRPGRSGRRRHSSTVARVMHSVCQVSGDGGQIFCDSCK
jgi:hypothetical protein